MSNNEPEIMNTEVEPVRPKRKYVKNPDHVRNNLWQRICLEHGITKFSKGTPGYLQARELYENCLKLKKEATRKSTIEETVNISTPKVASEIIYIDEAEVPKLEVPKKGNNRKVRSKDLTITTKQNEV